MKATLLLLATFLAGMASAQQNKFIGIWEGKINVGVNLRIAFHFSLDSTGKLFTTMDSPDQSAFGMATDYTSIRNDSIFTGIEKYKVSVAGTLTNDSTISGTFTQTVAFPLQLKKVVKVNVATRAQTPVPPFPYNSEEVTYPSVKNVMIAGTITSPRIDPNIRFIKAPVFPAILLISGSGPQNRDEEVVGHKPFAVLADMLTKKGFIVLRVDDRGIGKSTGDFTKATSADFAEDVMAGINFLRKRQDVDTTKIGLLGHSEGGMIAPMVAAKRKDINFLILLAGPGIKPIDLMTEQNIAIFNTNGISKKTREAYGPLYKKISLAIVNSKDSIAAIKAATIVVNNWLKGKDNSILKELGLQTAQQRETYVKNMASSLSGPWYKFFLNYDPAPVLKKVNAKVLVLNGDKDIQVLSPSNLAGMKAALSKTGSVYEIHEIKGVNHLFQNCTKCTVAEYGELDETISPAVLGLISDWLTRVVK